MRWTLIIITTDWTDLVGDIPKYFVQHDVNGMCMDFVFIRDALPMC